MLKTVCDQLPESDPDLATQPTFSRLENSVTKKDLMRLSRWLLGRYVRSLKKRRPSKIILDLDSTDDHTHGQQEFSFYHGYYRNHILHPLLIFDADTGDLVCAAASRVGAISLAPSRGTTASRPFSIVRTRFEIQQPKPCAGRFVKCGQARMSFTTSP